MPVVALGLTVNLVGAIFLYLSTRDELGVGAPGLRAGEERSTVSDEAWLPDQDPNGILKWLRSGNKKRLGYLLLVVGFALQLLGFYVPGSRIVA